MFKMIDLVNHHSPGGMPHRATVRECFRVSNERLSFIVLKLKTVLGSYLIRDAFVKQICEKYDKSEVDSLGKCLGSRGWLSQSSGSLELCLQKEVGYRRAHL